ncbi:MAG: flagellin [Rhodocyclaceae bacterium]|nr:flagellin [Rhodocyclaceae bacterium]
MAATINTNVSSLNSQRELAKSSVGLATALQRLSSGLRINSAKDDAAGLAISARFTSQINGLNVAQRNANDGISLAQTAEGALDSVTTALQRMRELAVQASNATNSATDRASLQKEVDQLVEQINTVSTQTSFNGVKLLDGTFNAQSFQIGANSGETLTVSSIASAKVDALGVGTTSSYSADISAGAVVAGVISSGGITVNGFGIGPTVSDGVSYNAVTSATSAAASTGAIAAFTINGVAFAANTATYADATLATAALAATINAQSADTGVVATIGGSNVITYSAADGRDITVTGTVTGLPASTTGVGGGTSSAIAKAAAFNAVSGETGVTATATSTVKTGTAASTGNAIAGNSTDFIKINGVTLGAIASAGTATEAANNITAAINAVSDKTGVKATFNTDGEITLTAQDGRNINIDGEGKGANAGFADGTTFGGLKLTSTREGGITVGGKDIATAGLTSQTKAATSTFGAGLSTVDITTATGAQSALATIDSALANINSSRANLGAVQNRFLSVVSNLATTSENLSASRARILDADFAAETANLSKMQILQQAGTAMLAQANSAPQGVLSLLR